MALLTVLASESDSWDPAEAALRVSDKKEIGRTCHKSKIAKIKRQINSFGSSRSTFLNIFLLTQANIVH